MAVVTRKGYTIEVSQREMDVLVSALKAVRERGFNPEVGTLANLFSRHSDGGVNIDLGGKLQF